MYSKIKRLTLSHSNPFSVLLPSYFRTLSSPIDHDRCCIFTIQHKDLNSLNLSSFFNHFKNYGWVELAVCLEKGADGFVQFHYPEHARKALKHPRHDFGATSLKLYPSDPKFFKGYARFSDLLN